MLRTVGLVLGVAMLWFALTAPTAPDRLSLAAFGRLPLEAIVLAALILVMPARGARAVGLGAGLVMGVVAVLKLLDLGTFTVLGRPFELITDMPILTAGLSFVGDAAGPWAERGVAAAVIALTVTVLAAVPWTMLRLVPLVRRHRHRALQGCAALMAAWLALAVAGVRSPGGDPVAMVGVAPYTAGKVTASIEARRDLAQFEQTLAADPLAATPPSLSAFAGTDVLVVFVESYGRVGSRSSSLRAPSVTGRSTPRSRRGRSVRGRCWATRPRSPRRTGRPSRTR